MRSSWIFDRLCDFKEILRVGSSWIFDKLCDFKNFLSDAFVRMPYTELVFSFPRAGEPA